MNELPNFDATAARLLEAVLEGGTDAAARSRALLADHLRVAWNARGAVDVAAVERELSTLMGATAAGPYMKNLQRALRTLDR